ncbi:oxygen-independent coproporphyrinogen III oxidase [Aquabacterium sp. J223]|uniref:oxygen-independent coproporphyrinogen III oxidase n=1 Tax=Aquabacterium sp. J223 TaxID=2898431 RepID=UPI0021AE0372|nr:oxygen-independent coproporphyrinogen III oxidase [Aquabacterium sp. J223]UUX95024.1 oxygen-independent coproporphyrinogen III oxidase [Aquabacterium sp. J223]
MIDSTTSAPAARAATALLSGTTAPRYTSYPTADRFREDFGPDDYARALGQHARAAPRPLSLYVHLPFCESVCYYCACNKVVTRDRGRAVEYLAALEAEIELHARLLGTRAAVSQVHFGGGTPTFLDDTQLARLTEALERAFAIAPGAERAIEIDPRTVDAARLSALAGLGFDRLSFGVQDFDPAVQQAVHRVQPFESVASLVHAARRIGFEAINVDLIYGLPRQTPSSFARTLDRVRRLRPDRIALYAYAHLPERFKPQRRIDAAELPPPDDKVAMLRTAIDTFVAVGYDTIGMDHFALGHDALAVARREGRLQRNFQGYASHTGGDLIGLGVSAIGQIGDCYAQNAKALPDYLDAVRAGRFATERGLALQADDRLRRDVIMSIMCRGRLVYAAVEAAHAIDFRSTFADELVRLRALAGRGWVEFEAGGFSVTPAGWYAVRAVAAVFDRHLQAAGGRGAHSRIA